METAILVNPAFTDSNVVRLFGNRTRKPVSASVSSSQSLKLDIFIYGNISDNLRGIAPLQITIDQQDDGSFIVADDIFLVYGEGDDNESALADYTESLWEFYELVSASAKTDLFDKRLLTKLNQYIVAK